MKKSVYSLVLSDAVVSAIDRAAYSQGLSRSALINSVLADYVSYVTPEKRMQDIFRTIEELFGDTAYRCVPQPSESMFSLRAPLAYKYNPTIRYCLELFRGSDPEGNIGVLRISLRTQSTALQSHLETFFSLWAKLEQYYTSRPGKPLTGGRYEKAIRPAHKMSDDELGRGIAAYIETVEENLNRYFSCLGETEAVRAVEEGYRKYRSEKATVE
ncbi:MAG: hypothetical protein ACI4WZ_03385 [Eubacteriales bacterium]